MTKLRVLIVDDHEIVREGLTILLEDEPDIEVVGEAKDGIEALELAATLAPQVVLMDVALPKIDGIEATRQIRTMNPAVQVLLLTGNFGGDLHVREAIQAGVVGYLLKDILRTDLVRAIKRAAEGKPTLHPEAQEQLMYEAVATNLPHHALTERELDVLKLIGQGMSNKKIAVALNLSEGTVKGYVSIVLSKLALADRTQAALYAVRNGLITN